MREHKFSISNTYGEQPKIKYTKSMYFKHHKRQLSGFILQKLEAIISGSKF